MNHLCMTISGRALLSTKADTVSDYLEGVHQELLDNNDLCSNCLFSLLCCIPHVHKEYDMIIQDEIRKYIVEVVGTQLVGHIFLTLL